MRIIPCQKCGKPITVYGADLKPDYKTTCQGCLLVWNPKRSKQKAAEPIGKEKL